MAPRTGYEKLQNYDGDFESEDRAAAPSTPCNYNKSFLCTLVVLLIASNTFTWYVSGWRVRRQQSLSKSDLSPYGRYSHSTSDLSLKHTQRACRGIILLHWGQTLRILMQTRLAETRCGKLSISMLV